MLRLFTRI